MGRAAAILLALSVAGVVASVLLHVLAPPNPAPSRAVTLGGAALGSVSFLLAGVLIVVAAVRQRYGLLAAAVVTMLAGGMSALLHIAIWRLGAH
jgi:hypothetical protein